MLGFCPSGSAPVASLQPGDPLIATEPTPAALRVPGGWTPIAVATSGWTVKNPLQD